LKIFAKNSKLKSVSKLRNAYTLTELLVVVAVITLVATASVVAYRTLYREYKFLETASAVEQAVRLAKITAMEQSSNTGVCLGDGRLTITDMGTSRSSNAICEGNPIHAVEIPPFVSLEGRNLAFDPRGFALRMGSICVSDGEKYYKVVVSRWGAVRVQKGGGACP